MKGLYTILLLIVSNVFMTFAWYGHLKLQDMKVIANWPLHRVSLLRNIFVWFQPIVSGLLVMVVLSR